MLKELLEFLATCWETIIPYTQINEYRKGVHLRQGLFKRVVGPGPVFKIPFFDEIITTDVAVTTISLPAQSLYTKDKINIVVKGVIKYKIIDVRIFLLDVFDAKDALSDMSQGIIKNQIMSKTLDECMSLEIDKDLTKKIRTEAKKWGVEIEQVTLTDNAPIKSFRLINDNFTNFLN